MATKAYEAFKQSLAACPIFFWSGKGPSHNEPWCEIRCQKCLKETDRKAKKLSAREVWNGSFKCEVCQWDGQRRTKGA